MKYEDLDIKELPIGQQVSGIYRGQKFHEVPDDDEGTIVMGRVFLEAEEGPVAVGGEAGLRAQVEALGLTDGDHIIIHRPTVDSYHVLREGAGSDT